MGEERMPAGIRMRSSNDALGKDEVDDKEQDHPGRYNYLRRHGNLNLGLPGGPHNSHYAGNNARHTEAEHHPGHDEFVTSLHIQLKDGHVSNGAEHKQEEEDGGDRDIDTDGRNAAEGRGSRRIRWAWRLRWSLRAVSRLRHNPPTSHGLAFVQLTCLGIRGLSILLGLMVEAQYCSLLKLKAGC